MPITKDDLWIVSSTLWGECRGEPYEGKVGVALVIRNRQTLHRRWQGLSLQQICLAPKQFSCWNVNDPNRAYLLQLTVETPGFSECVRAMLDVFVDAITSPVGDATHYYNPDAVRQTPLWARGKIPVMQVGHHLFFKDIA